jgi:hypothetical protein
MPVPFADSHRGDRRWYPIANRAEWIFITRRRMFESVRACVAHAIGRPLEGDITPHSLSVSDAVFRELHHCVEACSRELYAVGQDEDGVVAMVLAGAAAAADPDELHPAVIRAMDQWCREARQGAAEA